MVTGSNPVRPKDNLNFLIDLYPPVPLNFDSLPSCRISPITNMPSYQILFLGINYWPEKTGISLFNTGRCEYFAARGYKVSILTAFPYYPLWKISAEYRRKFFQSEGRNGVAIFRSFIYVPRKVTTLRRIVHEGSFIFSSFLRALFLRKPDLLFVVSPPLGLGGTAFLLSRLWKIPYIFHVPDLQPDAARDLRMIKSSIFFDILYKLEKFSYDKAAKISTLTRTMRAKILSKGIPAEKVVLLPDWADPDLFLLPNKKQALDFKKKYGLENKILVAHTGNMGVKQGLDIVIEAAADLKEKKEIVFLLVGDGADRYRLEEKAKKMDLPNLQFISLLPKEEYFSLLSAVDLCLVTQKKEVGDIVFPSKVMTYLAASKPVVCSVNKNSEVAKVIEEAQAGVVVPAEDPKEMAKALRTLAMDKDTRKRLGENGREYAFNTWEKGKVLEAMEKVVWEVLRKQQEHQGVLQ
ncbi:glycosyltransferase family 4 protein [Candidatus Methylacidiphilum fumarolicum]|uniref:glycosyltransferase family 4 protein n=1 Tax=Candidatus Methylacidiphilum fumarolicum TaxID=591154 RepID=UPI00106D0281|nr:glycosyltransferase family 4 protein [Candidatus Methylacidiphilum fumarolicum]